MRLRLTATLLAFFLIGLAFAFAQGPGGREGRMQGRPFPMPLMVALDTNNDGELSEKEIASASESLKTLDKDKNGKLTADEHRPNLGPGGSGTRGGGGGRNSAELVTRMMAFDKNKDGKLSKEELPERMQSLD